MFSTLEELLFGQSYLTGFILLVFGILLARRGLFHWTTTGFWAWAAFALYFLINPLASIYWNLERYRLYLFVGGGLSRGEWIGLVAAAGMATFFISYLLASSQPVTWNLDSAHQTLTFLMKLVLAGFIGLGILSLLTFRTGLLSTGRSLQFENGRYVGQITGYEHIGHVFLFVPVVYLLLAPGRSQRLLGWLLGCGYVVLSMPDGWSRFTLVSMCLAISLADTLRRQKMWPRPIFIIAGIVLAAALQLNGHTGLTSAEELITLKTQISQDVGEILAAPDAAMLSTWYVESYIKDTLTGYDYGIPFINYSLFGFIPSRFFPQKYFLVDWLRAQQFSVQDPLILALMYGAKSSLLGSFYANGGLLAIVLQMGLMGLLCRKMDGMLSAESPQIVKAAGIGWMSLLWMIWGSADYWALVQSGSLLIPALCLWFLAPKVRRPSPSPLGAKPATGVAGLNKPFIGGKRVIR